MRSWVERRSERAPDSRVNQLPLGNRLGADFDENVSKRWPIDKGSTPSYLSTKPGRSVRKPPPFA